MTDLSGEAVGVIVLIWLKRRVAVSRSKEQMRGKWIFGLQHAFRAFRHRGVCVVLD